MSRSSQALPLLTLRGIGLEREGHRLLSDIQLEIQAGERLVILGPNGAGKTLLMQVAHRLIQPTRGEIVAAGAVREAMVFQRPVLLRRSVIGNVLYALDHARPGWSNAAASARAPGSGRLERAQASLRLVGLESLAHRAARVLSGGEQQRVALARAAALQPDLIWFDEPTASLDPASTRAIESIVMHMSQSGVTCVMSTHDLGQARRLAQRVLLMAAGRIIEATPARRFFEEPDTESGRRYLRGELIDA